MGWLSDIKDKIVDDIIPNEVKSGSAAKKAIRNLIPNELADIAVKAAPFVAPFQPGIAAAMRGIGRFDQRGSISDALKQGAATYGFGKAANYGLSKIPTGSGGTMLKTSAEPVKKLAENRVVKTLKDIKEKAGVIKEKTGGGISEFFGETIKGDDDKFTMSDISRLLKDPAVTVPTTMLATYIKEKFFPGETQDNPYNVALNKRGDDVASYLRQYGEFDPTRDPNTDPFSGAEEEQFVIDNTPEYRNLPEYATGGRVNYGLGSLVSSYTANPTGGGRMGYYDGGDAYDPDAIFKRYEQKILKDRGYDPSSPTKYGKDIDSGIRTLQDILNVLFKDNYATGGRVNYASGSGIEEILMAQTGNQPEKMASMDDDYEQEFMRLVGEFMEDGFSQQEAIEAAKDEIERQRTKFMATGGRVNYAFGTKPGVVDQAAGIEGLDININPQGIKELDLRETGGFIPPVGVKEKADDIPAMLSNNEFVFTADAVKEAGDGDVNKGAERMYSMMKSLENGGRV